MEYFFIAIILALVCYAFYKKGQEISMFKRGSRNPFVRECKKCGAIHNQMCWDIHDANSWWEEVSEGNDPNCKCKNHQHNPLPGF